MFARRALTRATTLARGVEFLPSRAKAIKEVLTEETGPVPLSKFGISTELPPHVKFGDKYCKHHRFVTLKQGFKPEVATGVFVAPSATLAGNVELWDYSSVWYGAVIRGDVKLVRIGAYSSIGENTVIHEAGGRLTPVHDGSTVIGHYVTVGPNCLLRACTIEPECKVGANCILMEDSYMETHTALAPHSVLHSGQRVPEGELWAGSPAQFVRHLTKEEKLQLVENAEQIFAYADWHEEENHFLPSAVHEDALARGLPVGWQEKPSEW